MEFASSEQKGISEKQEWGGEKHLVFLFLLNFILLHRLPIQKKVN